VLADLGSRGGLPGIATRAAFDTYPRVAAHVRTGYRGPVRSGLLCLFSIALGCKPVEPAVQPPAAGGPRSQPSPEVRHPVVLPGHCVNPDEDFAARLRARLGSSEQEILEAHEYGDMDHPGDYDGDGTPDRVIVAGLAASSYGLVYIMRGSCGHFVGDLGAAAEQVHNAPWHHGLVDLRISESAACEGATGCTCVPGEHWYRFDGTVYQPDTAASRDSSCSSGSGH